MKSRNTFRGHSHKSNGGLKPQVITRELPPKVRKMERGLQLMCPFCVPTHPIVPGQESLCGTSVKVTAIQTIIPARTANDKGLRCMKCHVVGKGPMVRSGNGFVHKEDCVPGTKVLNEPPPHSGLAQFVYNMKDGRLKTWIEKRQGRAQCVKEIDVEGNETGKILSYFFLKV